jgi:Tfp pilus assembly protein PilO
VKGRDRIALMAVVVLAVLVAAWIEVVSPERQQASKLSAQVSSAQAQVASAESKLAAARTAESQYGTAYSSMVSLGKAVPSSQEVPSLIYQLSLASTGKRVQFASIGTAASGSSSASTAGASASTTSFSALPFTFVFEGSFFDLERLFRQLTSFTTRNTTGDLQVSGRLLTIQSVKLAPASSNGTSSGGELTGTVTASAYTAPASRGLSAAGAGAPSAAASPASSSGASSSPTAPAIIKVNP